MFEVEQKHRIEDLDRLLARLAELGGKPGQPQEQVDTYYAHPARDFAQTDEALRIRRAGNACFITYKGPKIDQTSKTRRELELPLSGGLAEAQEFAQLFELLGFRATAVVAKQRRKTDLDWQGRQVEVVIDQVDRLGQFVELELQADEAGLDQARLSLADLAAKLELGPGERRSYLELLQSGTSAAAGG
ncbi:MAG TPA: class IV adenylate cyclase [Pirellulales bacterium]|nr:class IV adenylate cyclase [Pirellulales bacterium]